MGRGQPAPGLQEPAQQSGRHRERRVGHHVVRAARETEIGGVGPHHGDRVVGEAVSEIVGPCTMGLDGDHPGAGVEQGPSERAGSRAHVDDEGARWELGVSDESVGPARVELVPSPAHGGAP